MATAYSYLRFSSPQQAEGDSVRRQTAARERWLSQHPRVRLDTTLVMTDAGRSAFRRKNPDTYALTRFVELIKAGQVEPGSYLLVENLDRLSREDAGEATELFLSIVNKGVVIVQLSPVVMEFRKPVNIQGLMFAIVELSRGHSESAIKSERGRGWWSRKHREADTRIITRKVPLWIRYDDGKLALDPAKAAVVRRMFELARDGYGTPAIAKLLNEECVPVLGRKEFAVQGQYGVLAVEKERRPVAWSGAQVWHILTSSATIGEYVPYRRRTDREAGKPVPNYYPAVVDADTFHAVRSAISSRGRVGRGRKGKHVNLFAGMLRDGRDGGTLTYWHTGLHPTVLISVNAKEGKGIDWMSFPAGPFESAVLSRLREVSVSDVRGDGGAARKVESLRGELAEIDKLIKVWTVKMDNPDIVDTVAEKLGELNSRRKEKAASLDEAQAEAANPVSRSWGEFRSLADLLAKDNSDDLRIKVRAALRRSIEGVTCVFARVARIRLAACRVQFRGGAAHRDYLIACEPTWSNGKKKRPTTWAVRSFADAGLGELDLQKLEHARRAEKLLKKVGEAMARSLVRPSVEPK